MTITHDTDIQAAPYDENLCDFGACIPQPGTTVKLQTLSDRGMWRAQYRNFGGWQTLVTSHSVDVGSDRAGARWYSIEKIGSGDWHMHDQGTFAPADALNRWMPSAAMDKSGDIAVGYSTSNGTAPNYPSISYAARLATDPPGTLGTEQQLIAGTGSQTGTANRWGDYSGMSVDPVDDCTFWYTTEYIQTTGATPWQHAHRLVQVPGVRASAGAAAASTAAPAAAPAAAATTSAGRVHDEHERRDDHSGHDRPRHPLRRLLAPRGLPVPRPPLQPDLHRGGRQLERRRSTSPERTSGGRTPACLPASRAPPCCSSGTTCSRTAAARVCSRPSSRARTGS